ncbi:MAG: translation elongation factor Ts [bacterium]|nr:translation elongation factor Ts [bacterium]
MTEISAKAVMDLRDKTGVAMMACKKALVEAGGDEEKAIEILRKRGEAKSGEKADRATGEGAIAVKIGGGKAAMASVRCETDFVGRNEDFRALATKVASLVFENGQTGWSEAEGLVKEAVNTLGENIQLGEWKQVEAPVLGSYVHTNGKIGVLIGLDGGSEEQAKDVAMHAAAMNPKVISPTDVTDELVAKEKEIWTEQLKNEGKPANIIDNILKGKEKKFREESALISQAFVKDSDKTVGGYLGGVKVVGYVRMGI